MAPAPAGGGGARFPKPPADAGALQAAAGKLNKAAGQFAKSGGHVKAGTAQAVGAPWHGNSSLAFVTTSHGVQQMTADGERAAATAASATSTFARVVHDVDTAIDGLNRRYNQAMAEAESAAAHQPANSKTDPYSGVHTLEGQLEKQYEQEITRYNTAAGTYAHALAGADIGDLWKGALHPVKWALGKIAGAMGQTATGFYDLLTEMHGAWGLLQRGKTYSQFLLRGMQSQFFSMWEWVPWLGKKAAAKASFYRDLMNESWRKFAVGSDDLGPIATAALKAVKVPDGAIGALGKAGGILGKVGPPIVALAGLHDVIFGAGHTGGRNVSDRVMGGVGLAGGAVMTASMLGMAVPPVGLAIAGGAVLAYGAYSLGNLIYDNRHAIGHAFSTAGNWVGNQATNVYHKVSSEVSGTVHAITHPSSTIHSIAHAFGL